MIGIAERKAAAREAAYERRKAARNPVRDAAAQAHLARFLAPHAGRILSGYMPIRTEIDPVPVMTGWTGPVCVPVIAGKGLPLVFHRWTHGCELIEGPFGARVPAHAERLVPGVLIVPLLAFDPAGGRLGYGGGFYDRTLALLRAANAVTAVGFAYSAQQVADLPKEPTDQRLDFVVTEDGPISFD